LIDGEKVSFHGDLNYFQCGQPNVQMPHRIFANGPAIKGGCVTWRSHPATYPGTLAASCPGGKTGMACFLPIQA